MSIKVGQAFERTSANPIDETLALTKAQMLAVNDNLMPAKYVTICQDDGKLYLYDKSATPNATTGKFNEFSGGKGHTIIDTDGTAAVDEDKLQFIGLDVKDNNTDNETEIESFGLNSDSLDDVTAGDVSPSYYSGEVYSTDEQVVGKWIDGRPIYQITVYNSGSFTVGSSSRLDTRIADLSSLNIEDVIEPVSGFSPNWAGTNQPIPVAVSVPSTNSVWADYIWVKSSKELHFRGQRSSGDTPVTGLYATLKYIKAS